MNNRTLNKLYFVLISLSYSLLVTGEVLADEIISDTITGKEFPVNVSFSHEDREHDLAITGLTVHKQFFHEVISIAHYVEQEVIPTESGDDIYQQILQNPGAKQLSMVFLQNIPANRLQVSLEKNINKNTTAGLLEQIKPFTEQFSQAITEDVKQGDELIIRWLPDGTVAYIFRGKQLGTIKSNVFARVLWSIWLGEKAVVDRNSLVKQLIARSS